MTHDDLATLLRDETVATEPTHALDPMVPVRLGRRRLRVRRLASVVAAAGLVAVAGVFVAPLVSDDAGGPNHALDPATQKALDDYDAQRMPQLMDDHVRAVLERSVPDLGAVAFRADDGNGDALPPDLYDKASGMSVSYGSRSHAFSVRIVHYGGEAEADAKQSCQDDLAAAGYLQCAVESTPDGDVVVDRLIAVQPAGPDFDGGWNVVEPDRLGTVDADRLWFAHSVQVIKSETLVTYVNERVKAPTEAAAEAAFEVPVPDLVEIGTDPVLVMPVPPLADDGCGPFVLDPAHGKQVCDDSP